MIDFTYWLAVVMLCLKWEGDWCIERQPVVSIFATQAECLDGVATHAPALFAFCREVTEERIR